MADDMAGAPPLQRDLDAGIVGGVASGLARHLGVDVTLLRVAFVLSTVLLGGLGFVTYLAGWVLIPSSGGTVDAASTARRIERMTQGRGAAFWSGATLVTIGGYVLLDTLLGPLGGRLWSGSLRGLVPPLALILLGVLLWRSSRQDGAELRRDLGSAFREVGAELGALEASLESYEAERRARREAEGIRLSRLTFGLAMLAFGGLWLSDGVGVTSLGLSRIGALSLLVVALGLLVGSFVGRPRGLVWAGLALTLLVVVGTVPQGLPVGVDDLLRPSTLAEIGAREDGLEFAAGRVTVDLTGLDVAELADLAERTGAAVDITLGAGELLVVLPDTITFDIDAELGVGRLEIVGSSASGLGLERRTTLLASDPTAPRVRLDLSQGVGRLTVIVRSAS